MPEENSLKCGVEIHQQLETHKLFCECPSQLTEDAGITFRRRLRPTQSELGEVDAAALEEARRDLEFVYEASDTCLVEADEEPPHSANREAIETALLFALLVGARPVDEVHFMRKLVIDGSNTTGFQRSALVATDGHLEMFGRTIGLPAILVEEDAARKVEERQGQVVYRLDRLGIPLIEVSTTPDIRAPDEARAVALRLGSLLRATRRVKRGIGTIREDLNVSTPDGARCEVKGVQELALIATYVEREAARQRSLAAVAVDLRRRQASVGRVHDVTESFRGSTSKVIVSAIQRGGRVLALPLIGFAGTLKGKLGPEMAAHARIAGVGGLFHSDELPAYGITEAEVLAVRTVLALGPDDGFALVADSGTKAQGALELAASRARAGILGMTAETRDPKPDGSTAYSRPLPGRARMYPETDVPPLRITAEWLERLAAALPELPEVKVERYSREQGIHRQQAQQLVDEGWDDSFELLSKDAEPKAVATLLLYDLTQLRREGVAVESVPLLQLRDLLALVRDGRFAREAVPEVLRAMATKRIPAAEAAVSIGIEGASQETVEREIDALLASRMDLVESRGMGSEGALMGLAMERLRGRAAGRLIRDVLHARLENLTAKRK